MSTAAASEVTGRRVPPPGGGRGAVLADGQLTIYHLVSTDPDVLAGARRAGKRTGSDDVTAFVASALGVGAKALAVADTNLDLAELDRSVQALTGQVSQATATALARLSDAVAASADTDTATGAIPTSVTAALARLAGQVTDLVAGTDAPVRATVADAVRGVTDQVLAEVQRAIAAQSEALRTAVAPDAPGSPLQKLRNDLVAGLNESHRRLASQIAELHTAVQVTKAREQASTTAAAKAPTHGLDYETAVLHRLEQIAYTAGDTLTRTGTTPGAIPRALTGDAIIDLAPNPTLPGRTARLVIEAKDRGRRSSATSWTAELDRARANRGADAALGLVRDPDQMPGAPRRLHILSPTAYLVAYDPAAGDDPDLLTAALLLLRAHAWAAVLDDHTDTDLDLPALRAGLAEGLQALAGFETLTKHTAAARKQLDDLDKATSALRTGLRAKLETTLRTLDPSPSQQDRAA